MFQGENRVYEGHQTFDCEPQTADASATETAEISAQTAARSEESADDATSRAYDSTTTHCISLYYSTIPPIQQQSGLSPLYHCKSVL